MAVPESASSRLAATDLRLGGHEIPVAVPESVSSRLHRLLSIPMRQLQ